MTSTRRRWALVFGAAASALAVSVCAAMRLDSPGGSSESPLEAPRALPHPRARVAGSWPNLFGPMHDSHSAERGLLTSWPAAGPPVKWRKEIGTGYGAPVAIGGTVIVFHREEDFEIVECLDAETGDSRWRRAYPATFDCPVKYSDGPYSTPVVDEESVYAIGAAGVVHCLDRRDGKPRWRRALHDDFDVPADPFGTPASPLLEGDRLILNLGGRPGAGIIALDKRTGDTLWTATDDEAGYATPTPGAIHGRRYVFVFTRSGLVALEPAGRVAWSIPFRANNPEHVNATSPVVDGDIVFVSGYALGNLAVRVLPDGGHEELWRDVGGALDSQYNNLVAWRGCAFGFSSRDNSLRCLDLATGNLRWRFKSELGRGATLAADGRLLVVGEFGCLASLELDTAEARLVAMSEEPVFSNRGFTAPALSDGLLFVRADTELACVDLRSRP
jgi:outer membrane protein assembly factor BamB